MCPGIAVLGGGGGAGGSGAGASKKGKGKKGAGKKKGSKNANGGKKNAKEGKKGKCKGAGKKGKSCTGCSKSPSAGDPVDIVTGKVFTFDHTDLFLPGFFDLELERSYSTSDRARNVGLGWGWTHTFAWDMHIENGRVHVRDGDGTGTNFPILEEGTFSSAGAWGLLRVAEGYVLRPGSEFFHLFTADPENPRLYRLKRIWYRNRGSIELEYEGGRLARVIDTAGRVIVFAGDHGLITSVAVAEPGGSAIVFARYTYDAGGFLTAFTDADGHSWRFSYDDDRRLIEQRLPTGLTFHYRYDRQGRCVETWGDDPAGDLGLSSEVTRTLADGRLAKGILHNRLTYLPDFTEVSDSVRVERYLVDGEVVGKAVNAIGGVTTRTFDDDGNEATRTDGNQATSHYEYDKLGELIREVDAEGRVVELKRDSEGRLIETIDPAGGRILSPRDGWGHVELIQHQNGGTETFAYDENGLVIDYVDVRGARETYKYDAHANLAEHTLPTGAAYRFLYDYWGRLVAEQLPNGGEYRYGYSNRGDLLWATDPIGRVRSYEYDALGNELRDTLPDGSTTQFIYNGMGWPLTVIHPDGSRLEQRYNREGWALELWNEKGERSAFMHDAAGNLVEERLFNGRTRRFMRDPNGAVIKIEEPNGATEITRNAVGQVLAIVAPDGGEQRFEYDVRGELIAARQGTVDFEWERDAVGNITRETHTIAGKTYVVESQCDPAGFRTAVRTSLGFRLDTPRDSLGGVTELRADGRPTLKFVRDPFGSSQRIEFVGGGRQLDDLDPVGRLTRRRIIPANAPADEAPQPEFVGRGPGGSIARTYQYTPIDEIASVTTTDDGTSEFQYDIRRRVTRRVEDTREVEAYTTDADGNYFPASSTRAPVREYAEGDRIMRNGAVDYSYDERGFLTEKRSGDDVTIFRWNGFDLLNSVELPDGRRVEFQYDAFARRTSKRVVRPADGGGDDVLSTRHYVWDLLNLVHEVNVDGGGALRTFLFEDNDEVTPIGHREGGDWLHYVADMNGTPEDVVDSAGNRVAHIARSTFGAVAANAATPIRYPGQYADDETGLHYNRYRYYDPEIGRYISPDPIGYEGGLNLYSYGPNPIGWFDPMGWAHTMTGTWKKGSEKLTGVHVSGTTNDCPPHLASRAQCHSERKFLDKLQKRKKKGGKATGKGEYPPCTNCHRALQAHADASGTEIKYEWTDKDKKKQTITYKPNKPPTGEGTSAQALTGDGKKPGAYSMTKDPNAPKDDPYGGYSYDKWTGTKNSPGAQDGYTKEKKNADAWVKAHPPK